MSEFKLLLGKKKKNKAWVFVLWKKPFLHLENIYVASHIPTILNFIDQEP